jgi:hypothetical protein
MAAQSGAANNLSRRPQPLLFILISPAPSFEPRRGKSVQRPIRLIGKTIKITLFFFPLGTGGAAKNKGRRMGQDMLAVSCKCLHTVPVMPSEALWCYITGPGIGRPKVPLAYMLTKYAKDHC